MNEDFNYAMVGISILLLPGLPGGIATSWVVSKLRKKQPATGILEEFVCFVALHAAIMWLAAIGYLVYRFV